LPISGKEMTDDYEP